MYGIIRQLKEIGQAMGSISTRKDLPLFLKHPENAHKVNGLVEDIRHALMDYQVCSPKNPAIVAANLPLDLVATRHLQRGLSADCESYSLTVPPCVVTCE